ncbi:MAG: xanthine dehydrogenase molybdopterin binding subunit [Bdellovibrio sp.]|nr:xanthine dehydrogenase molybdopterin binding subunit [Bdellovibrio sp.]
MSIGQNQKHDSSVGHVTGQSIFIDDRGFLKNEIHAYPVGVPAAAGLLKKIDYAEALKIPGILAIYTAKDFSHNQWGTIVSEQPVLVADKIGYYSEPACIIVGENHDCIRKAKSLIRFDIEAAQPIFTVDEAIKADSYIYKATPFIRGDIDDVFKKAAHTINHVFECGGQEHFYMESQASIAYPMENGQIEIHSSSQHPTETQHVVAEALGLSQHQVVCVVKRMGGGFGGKESQAAPFAAMAALAAQKLNRACRIALTKDDDMMMTGKRHPFKNWIDIAFDHDGKILGLKATLYANGGAYADLSSSILERAMFHVDSAYYIPSCHIEGFVVRTNMHSNTAFRGFGGPQGAMAMESIIEEMARLLKKDAYDIRRMNCYGKQDRNVTPYGQKLENNLLPEIFDQLVQDSDYKKRLHEIEIFNAKKNGKVKGISFTPTKFGISFTARFLNQANAQVNIHKDGTIQVSTGATEMGQGVNTKIQQIVAHTFSIPADMVQVMTTSTEKNHNTSPTAASAGADLNGAAAFKACENLKKRILWLFQNIIDQTTMNDVDECPPLILDQLRENEFSWSNQMITHTPSKTQLSWSDLVIKCYFNRISLGEYAHFKTEGLGFDKKTGQGTPFKYFTNGVAVSEVCIDEFTGECKVERVDILMELGRLINPGIDYGQVTGAFVQGMGWVTTENLFYSDKGQLLSHSPTTYKIPNIQDTPRIFNVQFNENDLNIENVKRSKAVGEPPFLLGISVWTAIKHAIGHRAKEGRSIELTSPATAERILMELSRHD